MSTLDHLPETRWESIRFWSEQIIDALQGHGFTTTAVQVWMTTPHPDLGSRTPVAQIRAGWGVRVWELARRAPG